MNICNFTTQNSKNSKEDFPISAVIGTVVFAVLVFSEYLCIFGKQFLNGKNSKLSMERNFHNDG